jgi:hypothetical protein
VGRRDGGGAPGEVLAVHPGTPERGAADEPAQAGGARRDDGHGDGGLGRRRWGRGDRGRAQRRDGPQRDAAPGAVGDRAARAVQPLRQQRVGAVEDVEQAGQRAVGRVAVGIA